MRRTIGRIVAPAAIVAVVLAGCSSTSGDGTGSATDATTGSGTVASTDTTAVAATADVTVESVMADNTAPHEQGTDAATSGTTITLSGDTATVDGDGAKVDGSTVTITAEGTYTISGTLEDGKVVVDSAGDGTVHLVLDGADVSSSTTSPLQVLDADDVVVTLADGSSNHLSDTTSHADDDDASGALYSSADLTITGTGALDVDGNANDGIVGKDGLVIESGTITVDAVDDGIRGKDYLVVDGGTITVTAGGDALKSDVEDDAALGYVEITDGELHLTAGDDGVAAQTDVVVAGGSIAIVAGGGHGTQLAEDASPKGITADAVVVIGGGTLDVDSADDAIHSNGVVSVTDGTVSLATGDDGIHADSALQVSGGSVEVTSSYEGLEAAVITISGGDTSVTSSDDGVNGSAGSTDSEDSDATQTADDQGGQGGQNSQGGPMGGGGEMGNDASVLVTISGGSLVVDADGDGLDSNGSVVMTGGTVVVQGPTNDGNGALDYNGAFMISGGELIAVGASGMAQTPSADSEQSFVGITTSGTQEAGTVVSVVDADGGELATFTATTSFSSVVYSSPDVTKGETYTLVSGSTAGSTVAGGLSQDGTPGSTSLGTGTAGEESSGMGGGPGG
ncbi:carbohydrate-binding domain-containing protein, partial [Cellulomonas sp. HZM]|uniref:carbohydrate-binding domain-containing protein n=1 Tax=Cellulomonas sp. HZM TaxID=1454010 RepID=UPI0004939607